MKKVVLISSAKLTRSIYIFFTLLLISVTGFSQNVGINATGNPPDVNAGLDVDFASKGLLIPRLALTSTTSFAPLAAHVAGMIVYNTATTGDVTPGFYYNNGTRWIASMPNGTALGDMLYWNGSAWVRVPAGTPGQFLQFSPASVPTWTGSAFIDLTTTAVSAITAATATSGGTIVNANGTTILSRGVCFATTTNPTTGNTTVAGTAVSPFICNLSGLVAGTIYYIRAYATNSSVVSYGNQLSFSTLPTLTTTAASIITTTTARTGGAVTTGNAPVIERGVCYGTISNPTTASTKVIDPSPGAGSFVSDLTGLAENTLYYVRSYAINASGTAYGLQITLTTLSTLTTTAITGITQTGASSGGTIAVGGNGSITARGVCWSTSPGPTTALTTKTNNGTGSGSFVSSITGLTGNTTYYVRAYATNAGGTSYGNELSFTTAAAVPPVLATTTAITSITASGAYSGGSFTNDGGAPVTAKGVCWGTSSGPVLGAGNFTSDGTGTGAFGSTITGLSGSTTYYIRSYGTNSAGTGYGPELTFTTCVTPVYNIGDQVGGGIVFYVDCNGGGLIGAFSDQSASVAWGCSGTAINTPSTLGTGSANTTAILNGCVTRPIAASVARDYNGGGFTDWYLPSSAELGLMMNQHTILNLYGQYWTSSDNNSPTLAGIWYYLGNIQQTSATKVSLMRVRAIRSFTAPTPPTVTTDAVSNIGAMTATSGGNITSDGGAAVTVRGVCWSTTSPATVGVGNFTTDGTGTGAFPSSIAGLTPATLYYVRAYATNSAGTAYGNEVNFTTIAIGLATVSTDAITNLLGTSATTGGNVTADGGSAVTWRGVCWDITPNPDLTSPTLLGVLYDVTGGLGTFVSNITGLTNGQQYYVRAFAINGAGTAYGADVVFTPTGPAIPSVTTDVISSPTPTGGTSGGNVTSDGTLTVTARGVCWSSVNYPPTIADSKTVDGNGTGTFTSNITGLTTGTGYWYAAYATNSLGTGYGIVEYYIPLGLPTVATLSLNYVAPATTATSGVSVTSDGGDPLTALGIVWNTSPNPTVAVNLGITTENVSLGWYQSSTLTGLVQSTTYYVRAYATNGQGTSYGAEISFTPGVAGLPTTTTGIVANKIGSIAEIGTEILTDGGDPVLTSGICWSTTADPTVISNLGMTIEYVALGANYSWASNLTLGTTYHVRAYATNGIGTAYGSDVSFIATAATYGQVIQGGWLNGYVFMVDGTGLHGLLTQSYPAQTATDWGCPTSVVGTTGTAIGTGLQNTTDIITDINLNACTSGIAPSYTFAPVWCTLYGTGYFLPSKDELNLMWTDRMTNGLDPGFVSAVPTTFWSSSEVDATHAWSFDSATGTWTGELKTAAHNFWAIRSF